MNMQKVLKFSRQKERNLEKVMGGYIGATVLMSPNLASNFHMQLTLFLLVPHPPSESDVCISGGYFDFTLDSFNSWQKYKSHGLSSKMNWLAHATYDLKTSLTSSKAKSMALKCHQKPSYFYISLQTWLPEALQEHLQLPSCSTEKSEL